MHSRYSNTPHLPRIIPGPGAALWAISVVFLLILPLGKAQNLPSGRYGGLQQPIGQSVGDPALNGMNDGSPNYLDEARRIRLLNAERQKSLVADTIKLLKLANELNAEIAKEDALAPTPAELRKIADIEKLAHNVQEKMKTTVIGTPAYHPIYPAQIP